MATKVAINGFGRIGRCIARVLFAQGSSDIELVAINDLTDAATLAHLLAFDSVHGRFQKSVEVKENALLIGDKRVPVYAEKDPAKLPWKELGVDVVIESTGLFTSRDGAKKHLDAGARRVPSARQAAATSTVRSASVSI